jgi:N-ethylmaleimide reductase
MMRSDFMGVQKGPVIETAREFYNGSLIANMGYSPEESAQAIEKNQIEAVAIGNLFISNPDLVDRVRHGKKLTPPDASTYYTSGPRGYTDYGTL